MTTKTLGISAAALALIALATSMNTTLVAPAGASGRGGESSSGRGESIGRSESADRGAHSGRSVNRSRRTSKNRGKPAALNLRQKDPEYLQEEIPQVQVNIPNWSVGVAPTNDRQDISQNRYSQLNDNCHRVKVRMTDGINRYRLICHYGDSR